MDDQHGHRKSPGDMVIAGALCGFWRMVPFSPGRVLPGETRVLVGQDDSPQPGSFSPATSCRVRGPGVIGLGDRARQDC